MSIEVSRLKPENTGRKSSSNQVCQRLLIVFFVAAMVLRSSGCASRLRLGSLGIGEALLETYRDRIWAQRAFNLRFNNCNIPYQQHFQSGFVAGYSDTCNGGDGYVPALPPNEYRGFEFQSPDGVQCVQAWFEGFPEGVAAAKKDRAGEFHDIYTSRMINSAITQDTAKHILPNDVPVLSSDEFGVPKRNAAPQEASKPSLDNGLVGSRNSRAPLTNRYVAPPSTSSKSLLNPQSLTPNDLVQAPEIRKSGPSAMAPVSDMQQFTIDPSVKVQPAITSKTAAPIATVDESLTTVSPPKPPTLPAQPTQPKIGNATTTTLPPIISTRRSQVTTNHNVQPLAPVRTAAKSQTPLPMAVRSAGNGWRSQTSSRRR